MTPVGLRIHRFMSPAPFIVADGHTVEYAARLMAQHRIRHLPVLHGGALVGVLPSEVVQRLTDEGLAAKTLVSQAMRPGAYSISADADLAEVASAMAQQRQDIAVVTSHGNVVGVFTTVDALRALAELARERTVARPPTRSGPPAHGRS